MCKTKTNQIRISRRKFLAGATAALASSFIPASFDLPQKFVGSEHLLEGVGVAKAQTSQKIIADHNAVALYDQIPQSYIDLVKTYWVQVPGESHSAAYRDGLVLLEALDSRFQVETQESAPPLGPTDQYLRLNRIRRNPAGTSWYPWGTGEDDFWTTRDGIDGIKNNISYCNTNGIPVKAVGFGWCWDLTRGNGSIGDDGQIDTADDFIDDVYHCHWYGSTDGNSSGWWGLDSGDSAINMQTYLSAVEEMNSHDPNTVVFFTTGPVDGSAATGERGYQRYLKHQTMRDYVNSRAMAAGETIAFFDYADILCWDNNGIQSTTTWQDYGGITQTFPRIVPAFDTEETGHIDNDGALRLAKAMWWMLARLAGWSGSSDVTPPDPPAGLTATPISFRQIDLSWPACQDNAGGSGIKEYHIYRDNQYLTATTDLFYPDTTGLKPDTSYTYKIKACDNANNISPTFSPEATAATLDAYQIFMPLIQNG